MKRPIRQLYPLTKTAIVGELQERGFTRAAAQTKAAALKPSYISKTGWVRRWPLHCELPRMQYCIVGTNAASLRIIREDAIRHPARARFTGGYDECQAVLAASIKQWFSLPEGREIESVAAARLELPIAPPPPLFPD